MLKLILHPHIQIFFQIFYFNIQILLVFLNSSNVRQKYDVGSTKGVIHLCEGKSLYKYETVSIQSSASLLAKFNKFINGSLHCNHQI